MSCSVNGCACVEFEYPIYNFCDPHEAEWRASPWSLWHSMTWKYSREVHEAALEEFTKYAAAKLTGPSLRRAP